MPKPSGLKVRQLSNGLKDVLGFGSQAPRSDAGILGL